MDPNLKCCVLWCHTRPNQGLRFYRFPCHNPQKSSIWEQRISQSANIYIDIMNDHICELHFDYRCKTRNQCALEEGSLPTLHLPSFGTLFSTGNAHFQMNANRIEEPSYTISVDALSYHCRFCLRRGLLYEVEASTYRNKSFLTLIDLPPNVLPDNTQPNACLSCLKSIVITHQLSVAVEHSNIILQLLLQHPKQSKVVSNTSFFDIKSDLAFCNLIPANSLSIKLEIDDNMTNENYEQKWVGTGESTLPTVYVNTQTMVEKSICITENQDNFSKIHDLVTTAKKQCPKEFHKAFAIGAKYMTDLNAEGIPDASENSNSCILMENTNDNAEVIVPNNSDDSCAEDRQFDNEEALELSSKPVNGPTCKGDLCKFTTNYEVTLALYKNLYLAAQTTFTTIDENTHWYESGGVYVCSICDWKTLSPHSFNTHVDKHVQSDKNSTIEAQELEMPKKDPVRNADGRYQCTECPKAFNYKTHFDTHKRIHTNERPYKCTVCPKTFSDKRNLNTHKRIHTNERPYTCTECPKSFNRKSNLVKHKRIHTNERPYKCTECPNSFIDKRNLDTHKRIHTNERPYKCTECPKTFSQNSNFIRHRRIHTNERPYKCTECLKTFSDNSQYSVHKRIHTNEKPYKCAECPKNFSQMSHFSVHKKIHTNESP